MKREQGPRILLSIANGWIVRNYVRSGIVRRLLDEGCEVHVLLPGPDPALATELRDVGADVGELEPPGVSPLLSFLTSVLTYAQNRSLGLWHGVFWKWVLSTESGARRLYLRVVELASWAVARGGLLEVGRRVQDRLLRRLDTVDIHDRWLQAGGYDLVVITNPFGFSEAALLLAAKRRGIPTAGAIYSWDNLSYKGRPLVSTDAYVVWSRLMEGELLRALPSARTAEIIVAGSPQFDFHLRPEMEWPREELAARIGADPARPIICYSAGTDLAFPDEPKVVADLQRAIERGEIEPRTQVVVRVHPHDPTDRFERLARRCEGVIVTRPWSQDGQRAWWFNPSEDELYLFSNLLRHSAVSVSAFSTVVLDSAVLDVPVVGIAYSHSPSTPAGRYTMEAPWFGHCRYVTAHDAVRIARSPVELTTFVNEYLNDASIDRDARRRLAEEVCGPADGRASDLIASGLLALAESSARHPRLGAVG